MCAVENHGSIYLYNADWEAIMSNKNADSSFPEFNMEEIRRGIYFYNCELDKNGFQSLQ